MHERIRGLFCLRGERLPVPCHAERVGRYFRSFVLLEQPVSGIAKVDADVAVTGLCQQVDADGLYVHTFAHCPLLAAVDVREGFYSVAYLKLRSGIEEYFAVSYSLLPFQQYGNAEKVVAKPASAVCGGFIAGGEETFSIFFQQGVIAVDVERTVSPADT